MEKINKKGELRRNGQGMGEKSPSSESGESGPLVGDPGFPSYSLGTLFSSVPSNLIFSSLRGSWH